MLLAQAEGLYLLHGGLDARSRSKRALCHRNADVPACPPRRVPAPPPPGVLTETVADLAFALILAFARRIVEGERAVRQGDWPVWRPAWVLGRDGNGAPPGIVGLGAIGLAVARRARGFG